MKKLLLIGGGGHCKSVIGVAESAGYSIMGILDKSKELGKRVLGYEVIGTDDDVVKYAGDADFIITVGQIKSPNLRIKLHQMIEDAGGHLATLIAPTAYVSKYAVIGEGSVVMHQAIVNADAIVGKGCIINTFANIEHDVIIGDYCHISTGAMINGEAQLDNEIFVGSQAVVSNGISICSNTIIGAGSVVNKSITKQGVYVGNQIKQIKSKL